jgi:SAM-dependent methyltransferase
MDVARHLKRLTPAKVENFYNGLVGYSFARRYVGGKSVVDLCWGDPGYGANILAEIAESVAVPINSSENLELASTSYFAPNVSCREAAFPELPYPTDHFDVAVALEVIENLERPEAAVKEIKRVLKRGGLLVVSTPDKQAYLNERNHKTPDHRREMYARELLELLEQHFEHVHTYRQGTVAGGIVFRTSEKVTGASVETTRLSPTDPYFGVEPPVTHFVLAVCSDAEVPWREDEQPYLLLDHDRRVFDECEDLSEDVELLRDEVQRMQKTEVQAFQEALHFRNSEIAHLRAQLERSESRLKHLESRVQRVQRLENRLHEVQRLENRLHEMENSATWRLFAPYRRLRAKIDALRKPAPGTAKGSDDRR